ncbi:MAG: hypothetical protein JWO03_3798 [Bacteroidetes bacterium]|nr:hypothetical protein [Bacteroidota bacterium]
MKTTISFLFFALFAFSSFAQKVYSAGQTTSAPAPYKTGVFMTYEDYKNGKITEAGKCKSVDSKKVKFETRTFTIKDDHMWGAVDNDGQLYRFTDKEGFSVLSIGDDLCMYGEVGTHIYKEKDGTYAKFVQEDPQIGFSHGGVNGEIKSNVCIPGFVRKSIDNEALFNRILAKVAKTAPSAKFFMGTWNEVEKWNAEKKK